MNSKLKPCLTCAKEIAKSATKCPHCGRSFSSAARLGLIVLVAGLVGWLVLGGWIRSSLEAAREADEAALEIQARGE